MSSGNTRGKTKKELQAALPHECFWVNNGPILSDLHELRNALQKEITTEQFEYHVTPQKNDFADWIENVLGDRSCAKTLRKVKKKETALKKVELCLNGYKKK